MPLPKDPQKIKEWKRKVSEATRFGMKHGLQVVKKLKIKKDMDFDKLDNKELLLVHAKFHLAYKDAPKGWAPEDISKLHNSLTQEMKKRKIEHFKYDDLDKAVQNEQKRQ